MFRAKETVLFYAVVLSRAFLHYLFGGVALELVYQQ